jgi:hypothetical protein
MKHYWVKYYGFGNSYNLTYTINAEQDAAMIEAGHERITRREAIRLCAAENYRRKHDSAFSGFADNLIYPIWFNPEVHTIKKTDGYIVVK